MVKMFQKTNKKKTGIAMVIAGGALITTVMLSAFGIINKAETVALSLGSIGFIAGLIF